MSQADSLPSFTFEVNGAPMRVQAHPLARLLDVLRGPLQLTGTKEGCGEGECGACSVFVDGVLVNSCLVPVCQAAGTKVETVEGLATSLHGPPGLVGPRLRVLQDAFVELGGAQCGICTPGMLMAAAALVRERVDADEAAIREALAGNLCRCTGYVRIVDAIVEACARLRTQEVAP